MQKTNYSSAGFTLMELLIVVLIIGILSSIALPQYQKAVEKTRAQEALINLRTLANAEKIYELANGTKTNELDKLDINLTGKEQNNQIITNNFTYYITPTSWEIVAQRNSSIDAHNYIIYVNSSGTVACRAATQAARPICVTISETTQFDSFGGYWYYIFPGINFYIK